MQHYSTPQQPRLYMGIAHKASRQMNILVSILLVLSQQPNLYMCLPHMNSPPHE